MAIDFPNSPSVGITYAFNSIIWSWNGVAWDRQSTAGGGGVTGATGATGPQGVQGGNAGRIYYLWAGVTSSGTTYAVASASPSANAITTITTAVNGTGNVLVKSFITDVGEPGVLSLPTGIAERLIHAYQTANNGVARLNFELYKRDLVGTETLLRSGYSDDFSNQTKQEIRWTVAYATAFPLLITDRLVFKVYAARVSGANSFNVVTSYEGADVSYVKTTISAGAVGPQGMTGATGPQGVTGPVGDYVVSFNGNTGAVTGASLGANTFTELQTFSAGISAAGGVITDGIIATDYIGTPTVSTNLISSLDTDLITVNGRLAPQQLVWENDDGISNPYPDLPIYIKRWDSTADPVVYTYPFSVSWNGEVTASSFTIDHIYATNYIETPSVYTNSLFADYGDLPLNINTYNGGDNPVLITNIGDVTGDRNNTYLTVDDAAGNITVSAPNGIVSIIGGLSAAGATFSGTVIASGGVFTDNIYPNTGNIYINGANVVTYIGDWDVANNGTYINVNDSGAAIEIHASTINLYGGLVTDSSVTIGTGLGVINSASAALTTTTANQTIAYVTYSAYRSAEFFVQASTAGGAYEALKITALHDGSSTWNTQYGVIRSGGSLGTYTTILHAPSGQLRLRVTPTTVNTTYKVMITALPV